MRTEGLFKKTAVGLTLVYLFLSISMTIRVESHLSEHGRHADHQVRHTSPACFWMCAATAFIHSGDPNLNQGIALSFENPIEVGQLSPPIFRYSNPIRPPPLL